VKQITLTFLAVRDVRSGRVPAKSGLLSEAVKMVHPRYGRDVPILLQRSFSTADQNFSRPLVRFSDKYVRDLWINNGGYQHAHIGSASPQSSDIRAARFYFVFMPHGRALFDHLIGGYLEVSYVVSRPEDIDLK
jgi:hypothetical protein